MPEALDLPALMAAAASAASADDIPTAAARLWEALELQTSTLGPDHPDIATTLNNLALMLEKLGHVNEAGRCYRRAHAIAAAALGPDDPTVEVCRANLDTFRATYPHSDEGDDAAPTDPGVWGELGDFPTTPAPPDTGTLRPPWRTPGGDRAGEPGLEPGAGTPVASDAEREETLALLMAPPAPVVPARRRTPGHAPPPLSAPRRAPAGRGTSLLMGLLIVTMCLVAAAAWWSSRSEPLAPPGTPAAAAIEVDAPAAARIATQTTPREAAASPAAAGTAPRQPAASSVGGAADRSTAVAVAELCSVLSRARNPWACEPVGDPVGSDAVYYYTRVRFPRDVTIRHRWTRGGRVVQDVRLRVRANLSDGFRTFSRQTLRGLGAGTWVVTLLGPDGGVLDERTFEAR